MTVEAPEAHIVRVWLKPAGEFTRQPSLALESAPATRIPLTKTEAAGTVTVGTEALTVRIDRLVIADHSTRLPTSREYRVGLNQNYTDVTELKQLFAPDALLGLAPVGAALHGLVPGDLGRALNEAVKETSKTGAGWLKDLGRKAGQKAKEYIDALEESRKP